MVFISDKNVAVLVVSQGWAKVRQQNLSDCSAEVEKEWYALEGVSRVNTLLNLQRFVPNKKDKSAAAVGNKKIK
ncbi:hypothetical protein KIW84_065709 [Lathyrus oleraceus]|uniref:Uncharacterized protein n=1 Tax=Pisum sativum TaxID=3888 RepID=A0A9D4WG80_PEA|nr:hypothetical protein KIW84_065709 [Pisum sativum]